MNNFFISKHFTFYELTKTSNAKLIDINRLEGLKVKDKLELVCLKLLEPLRGIFHYPVIIHSGFRCKAVNDLVRGNPNSQHLRGEAVDFHIKGFDDDDGYEKVLKWCKSNIEYGQLIDESRTMANVTVRWIHLSLPDIKHYKQALRYNKGRFEELKFK